SLPPLFPPAASVAAVPTLSLHDALPISDGRSLAGYSPTAKQFDQLPFGTGVLGITGWVRGWVELPSLELDIPEDGVTLCDGAQRSEEHTSELQSRFDLVCRLLLEKKKTI